MQYKYKYTIQQGPSNKGTGLKLQGHKKKYTKHNA
jgi:hypothetical protein